VKLSNCANPSRGRVLLRVVPHSAHRAHRAVWFGRFSKTLLTFDSDRDASLWALRRAPEAPKRRKLRGKTSAAKARAGGARMRHGPAEPKNSALCSNLAKPETG
jgi:hypothetical protein